MQDKIASQQRSVLGTCQGLLQVVPVNLGRSSLRYNGGSELHRGIMRAKLQCLRHHLVTIQSCLESRLLVGRCQVTGVKPSGSVLISLCLSAARASCELREQLPGHCVILHTVSHFPVSHGPDGVHRGSAHGLHSDEDRRIRSEKRERIRIIPKTLGLVDYAVSISAAKSRPHSCMDVSLI